MIWEWKSCSIVMLTELEERGQVSSRKDPWAMRNKKVGGDYKVYLDLSLTVFWHINRSAISKQFSASPRTGEAEKPEPPVVSRHFPPFHFSALSSPADQPLHTPSPSYLPGSAKPVEKKLYSQARALKQKSLNVFKTGSPFVITTQQKNDEIFQKNEEM